MSLPSSSSLCLVCSAPATLKERANATHTFCGPACFKLYRVGEGPFDQWASGGPDVFWRILSENPFDVKQFFQWLDIAQPKIRARILRSLEGPVSLPPSWGVRNAQELVPHALQLCFEFDLANVYTGMQGVFAAARLAPTFDNGIYQASRYGAIKILRTYAPEVREKLAKDSYAFRDIGGDWQEIAAVNGHVQVLELLNEFIGQAMDFDDLDIVLIHAIEEGQLAVIEDRFAKFNEVDEDGQPFIVFIDETKRTAMLRAVARNHIPTLKFLIDHHYFPTDLFPLSMKHAATVGDTTMLKFLLKEHTAKVISNADELLTIAFEGGNTLLHVLDILLRDGRFDPNHPRLDALTMVIARENDEALKLLLVDGRVKVTIQVLRAAIRREGFHSGPRRLLLNHPQTEDVLLADPKGQQTIVKEIISSSNNDGLLYLLRMKRLDLRDAFRYMAQVDLFTPLLIGMLLEDGRADPTWDEFHVLKTFVARDDAVGARCLRPLLADKRVLAALSADTVRQWRAVVRNEKLIGVLTEFIRIKETGAERSSEGEAPLKLAKERV